MSQTDPPSPQTEPRKIFGEQMDNLKYLLKNMLRDVERLNSPIDALEDHLSGLATIKIGPVPPAETSGAIDILPLQSHMGEAGQGIDRSLKPHIDRISAMVDDLVQTQPFLYDWMLVMSVTFAEAYLEGALQLLAAADESVMSGGQMLLTAP